MSKSRRTGTAFETAVVEWLKEHGFPYAERRALAGVNDRGDIVGIPQVMWECKAEKTITLGTYMDEVAKQKAAAGAEVGVAVVKRRSKGTGQAYVVMPLEEFVKLIL